MRVWPLTLRGTGAVLLGILCFILAYEFTITELLYVSALLLAVVAASVATLYLVRRTERVTRTFVPDIGTAGRENLVRARVEIRSPLPAAQGRWVDKLPDGVTGTAAGAFPAMASAMGSGMHAIDLEYTITTERRGVRALGPLSVTSTDPFGFARRRHTIGGTVPLTIAPAVIELGALTDLPGEAGGSMHSTTDQLGQGTDNLIPRHYTPGDSMRRIHWRATAHRDALMVRQEEQESTPSAVVVFDRSVHRWTPEAFRSPGTDPGFEMGVTACVSVVARLAREGYIVTVMDADGTDLVPPVDAGDSTGVDELTVAFATITARRDVALEELVRQFTGTQTGPLVLVTGRIDDADTVLLAPLTHHSTLPILLTVAPHEDALARSVEAGWHAAAIPPDADLAVAWLAALDRGSRRVGV